MVATALWGSTLPASGCGRVLTTPQCIALSPSSGHGLLHTQSTALTAGASPNVTSVPVQKVFVDPILAHDGTTFESSALLEHLKTSTISPTTGVDLGKNPTLMQNRSIKSAIEHVSR